MVMALDCQGRKKRQRTEGWAALPQREDVQEKRKQRVRVKSHGT